LEKETDMANVVVMGAQWGDEGKGKIVDILSEEADTIVRFQGGHNAGHTVVIGDEEYILHVIPSGILHPGKACVVGNGVVVDPEALVKELDGLVARGIDADGRLWLSDRAHLIMPYHVALDQGSENRKDGVKIGTTGRGIGPCYVDKARRSGIRVGDLLHPGTFREKIERNLAEVNVILKHLYGREPMDADAVHDAVMAFADRLRPLIVDASYIVAEAMKAGRHVLFEGAQGTLLDVDHGTYPFVTSSNPVAGGACVGAGVGPTRIDGVLGIVKAYTTRVGEGPFPTELNDDLGEYLRDKGGEFGATTGRARRCGWFDSMTAGYSARINGFTGVAITKLDVLDELETLKICTGYEYHGKKLEQFPSDPHVLSECAPVFEEHPGWRQSTVGLTSFDELPVQAKNYIARLEELMGVPADLVSTGQKRAETIIRRAPFRSYRRS